MGLPSTALCHDARNYELATNISEGAAGTGKEAESKSSGKRKDRLKKLVSNS